MKHTLYGAHHKLVHVLRHLQSANAKGVLDRKWTVLGDKAVFRFSSGSHSISMLMFPELEGANSTVVSGVRLLERSALMREYEGNEICRLCDDGSGRFDLVITAQCAEPLVVSTDDEEVFDALYDYFELTSSDSHQRCFS